LDLLEALILGIVQGATEFLPISSSGHLVLVPWWLGWDNPSLLFDLVLHLGTLVAVLSYFWRDWLTLLRTAARTAPQIRSIRTLMNQDPDARLLILLIMGTIPAVIIGGVFSSIFEAAYANPTEVAAELLVTATILVLTERYRSADRPIAYFTIRDALFVGLAQAFAIFPGISRSGTTIGAGMWRGLSRSEAARFSFLLSVPIIIGAAGYESMKVILDGETISSEELTAMAVGFTAAMVVGYLSIWFLMRLLRQRRLYGFAVYCAVVGTLSLLVALFS
jgi:undecaprenyl-diphosphatase